MTEWVGNARGSASWVRAKDRELVSSIFAAAQNYCKYSSLMVSL